MLQKLPKRIETTNTGITAEEYLQSRFGKFSNVIPTPASKDLGIDMRAELFEDNYPTGIHFNIQCKGTKELENEDSEINIPIKVSTINYWLQQREPTFLIVVDIVEDKFYWCYPFEQVKEKIKDIQNQEKITIKLDKKNVCDSKIENIPSKMLEHIISL